MLVMSYSDSKKRNLRRDVSENAARVSKVCREVVWPKVKFAPDSAFACFSDRSIFDMIITNCNLDEDEDKILFWCNNKDVVKDSLYQHRSNVTSRIKLQFRKGKNQICTWHEHNILLVISNLILHSHIYSFIHIHIRIFKKTKKVKGRWKQWLITFWYRC